MSPAFRLQTLSLASALLLFGTTPSVAQKIYKSVDADGVVSYSSSPPRDAPTDQIETVKVDPPPPEADRDAAQRRLQSMRSSSAGSGSRPARTADDADDNASKRTGKPGGSATSSPKQAQSTASGSRASRSAGGLSTPGKSRGGTQLPSGRTSR